MPGFFLVALVLFIFAAIAWRREPAWAWNYPLFCLGMVFLTLALGWSAMRGMFP